MVPSILDVGRFVCGSLLLLLTLATHTFAQSAGKAAQWKGMGVPEGAQLPSADEFKPRAQPEAAKADLRPELLTKLDIEMKRHVARSTYTA